MFRLQLDSHLVAGPNVGVVDQEQVTVVADPIEHLCNMIDAPFQQMMQW